VRDPTVDDGLGEEIVGVERSQDGQEIFFHTPAPIGCLVDLAAFPRTSTSSSVIHVSEFIPGLARHQTNSPPPSVGWLVALFSSGSSRRRAQAGASVIPSCLACRSSALSRRSRCRASSADGSPG